MKRIDVLKTYKIFIGGKFPRNPGITNFLLKKYNLKMPGGWYGSFLRGRSVKDEWAAMQDHLSLLKMVRAEVFVFADVSGSIQGDQSKKLSTRPNMNNEEFTEYCKKINEIVGESVEKLPPPSLWYLSS